MENIKTPTENGTGQPGWLIEYERLDQEFANLRIKVQELIGKEATSENNKEIQEIQIRQDAILDAQRALLPTRKNNK
jgi:hypothetical protein